MRKRPPQGTVTVTGLKEESIVRGMAHRITQECAVRTDPEIDALFKALAKRDNRAIASLIKNLKERYGQEWPEIAKVIQRRVK